MKTLSYACAALAMILLGCGEGAPKPDEKTAGAATIENPTVGTATMQIQYLEIVTPDVDAVCAGYAQRHGVTFSEPVPELGNARTAALTGGGKLGVRPPMRETEAPVVRPYVMVDDIAASVKAAEGSGATIAFPPMALGEHGTFAIYIQGGIEHGLWQR